MLGTVTKESFKTKLLEYKRDVFYFQAVYVQRKYNLVNKA